MAGEDEMLRKMIIGEKISGDYRIINLHLAKEVDKEGNTKYNCGYYAYEVINSANSAKGKNSPKIVITNPTKNIPLEPGPVTIPKKQFEKFKEDNKVPESKFK